MRLNNIHGCAGIDEYVEYKIKKYSAKEKNFESLFELMFDEADNVMAETSDGYRITKITYGQYKQSVLDVVGSVAEAIGDIERGEMVGFYMSNSIDWIRIFWAILAAGYSPLIMNTRLSDSVLEEVLSNHSVKCVISDSHTFSVRTVSVDSILASEKKEFTPTEFGSEVIFMSSGTTDNVKLCAYNGENFYYQICDSASIIEQCPKIKRHYEGELKQLMLLPLCHVFGFIAVYRWFGFFSRTFVFPRNLNPDTIQRTVKKHKVTHIFAVPMVWEAVHKAAVRKIKERGASTYSGFCRMSALVNKLGRFGDFLARRFLGEVRDGLFGDSICFLITGGSHIKTETLEFFNGIGYHLVNGYGMTEIGITSVEKSSKRKIANSASIGAPFGFTEYSISEDGRLLVRGKTRAGRIMQGDKVILTDYDEWFNTGDIMRCDGGRYFFDGRADDLIVGEDGENINPTIVERELKVDGADGVCVIKGTEGITVVLSVPGIFSESKLKEVYAQLDLRIAAANLSKVIKKIAFTHESLLRPGEFKLNRKKLAERFALSEIRVFDPRRIDEHVAEFAGGIEREIASCFAEVLGKEISEISPEADFFRDLGGTSIDYITLMSVIKSRLGIDIIVSGGAKLSSVKDLVSHVREK